MALLFRAYNYNKSEQDKFIQTFFLYVSGVTRSGPIEDRKY
jgi:hypothetical protein